MMKLLLSFTIIGRALAQDIDYAQFVNPFIGSEGAIPGYACLLNFHINRKIADKN
jgi:hypothetical protein